MTRRVPGVISRRFLSATGFDTPSHTVTASRCRSAKEYSDGSVLSRQSEDIRFSLLVGPQLPVASVRLFASSPFPLGWTPLGRFRRRCFERSTGEAWSRSLSLAGGGCGGCASRSGADVAECKLRFHF